MRVLGLDTATAATAVALRDERTAVGLELAARDDPPPGARPGHARVLLGLIDELVRPAGGWATIDRIAVGIGPGTFTGLRIGVASAQALARACGAELVGVSTLASLALCACAAEGPPTAETAVLAVIDARRGEAFAAAWGAGTDPETGSPALGPSVLGPDALAACAARLVRASPAGRVLAVGDGALVFKARLQEAGVLVAPEDSPLHRVSAIAHCRLGGVARPQAPASVLPLYLRRPDAELSVVR